MSINGREEMTSPVSRGRPEGGFLGRFRAAALIAVLAGAAGSIGLMLHARQYPARLLLILFVIWVLSPANLVAKRWSASRTVAVVYFGEGRDFQAKYPRNQAKYPRTKPSSPETKPSLPKTKPS